MRHTSPGYMLAMVLAIVLTGCAKSTQSSTAPASPQAAATIASTPEASASAMQTPAAMTGESPTAAASPAPVVVVSFSDIGGIFAEQNIKDMAALGVFDATSGTFHPSAPIKRSEFVRWLVKANNAYFIDDAKHQIRPAEGTDQAFVDVPPTHPDYKYIQALANAGFVIGIDQHHFAPDQSLTREQMIAIKVGVDLGGDPYKNTTRADVRVAFPFSDIEKISKRYYDAIYGDNFDGSKNIPRVFGAIKTFQPQKPVTRAEAALCLAKIGNYTAVTAAQALAKPAK